MSVAMSECDILFYKGFNNFIGQFYECVAECGEGYRINSNLDERQCVVDDCTLIRFDQINMCPPEVRKYFFFFFFVICSVLIVFIVYLLMFIVSGKSQL
jgi:hypothetical protein